MTQEDKELLLKDLCSRLPYGVILVSSNEKITYQTDGNTGAELLVEEEWKPYLRPMSSITKEEYRELEGLLQKHNFNLNEETASIEIDWLNAHHFDYRGLIPKGLAVEAPEGIYNTNNE